LKVKFFVFSRYNKHEKISSRSTASEMNGFLFFTPLKQLNQNIFEMHFIQRLKNKKRKIHKQNNLHHIDLVILIMCQKLT